MLLILHPNTQENSRDFQQTIDYLKQLTGVEIKEHIIQGQEQKLTELYLLGNTASLNKQDIESLPAVERVIRISQEYRILGRHQDDRRLSQFEYNGVCFGQDSFHVIAGLCAVDNRQHVEQTFQALQQNGQVVARMGAYKPRTNPYSFQGHGQSCLHYVFELAGKYGIKAVTLEVTHENHIEEIDKALEETGRATGAILQIGTRNTQNFELLKAVGRQTEYPALLKRGFGITLNESLNAAEYLASEGNTKVIFCLRGMKGEFGAPHRNLVDFAHVPVIKRLTRMPVCIDPSHSVGTRDTSPDGIMDLCHATAQGVIAGANMVLVDFHPKPGEALVDGPQALLLEEMPKFLADIRIARDAYLQRKAIWESST